MPKIINKLQTVSFLIGRRIGKRPLAGRTFCLTERWLPLHRIERTSDLVAFHHPRPIANPHILIVPTLPFPGLSTKKMPVEMKARLIWNACQLAQGIVTSINADACWQLVFNGGTRQDIGQVHGHLLRWSSSKQHSGQPVTDPAIDPGFWCELFTRINAAAQNPENGYSLVFRWGPTVPFRISWEQQHCAN